MQPKQYVISIRRVGDEQWDAALIVDGRMERVYTGKTLEQVMAHATDLFFVGEYSVGTRIVVKCDVERPEDADAK